MVSRGAIIPLSPTELHPSPPWPPPFAVLRPTYALDQPKQDTQYPAFMEPPPPPDLTSDRRLWERRRLQQTRLL